MANSRELSNEQKDGILRVLKSRFEKHPERHAGIAWSEVEARLNAHPDKLWSLNEMEETGGEPDVVGKDPSTGGFLFYDCAAESPKGRRSYCYDRAALDSRKEFKPANSVIDAATAMGTELLNEEEYRALQGLGEFDLKTSSWIQTPDEIRKRGGALFCDRRYDHVFTYHNGAESYYAARGFRVALKV
jgi:hypothetical protein